MKKEKSQLQQEIRRLSNENTVLENKNKELEIKNRELKADNDAHIEFAKEAFLSDPSSSEKFVKMEEQINQLRCENQEKDKQISEMRSSIPQQDPKITAKNKEIQSLKSQISALEVRTSELQDSEQQCRRELNVKIADYQREKDINTLLLQNKSQPAQPEISSEPRDENGGQAPSHTRAPTTSRIEKKSARRLCCYEVLEKDSCPYQNRCMFNHLVSDENRDDISITNEACEKKSSIHRNPRPRGNGKNSQENYCEKAFLNGPGSCVAQCTKVHRLNFERINRGICHFVRARPMPS